MSPTLRNGIMFVVIAGIVFLGFTFFFGGEDTQEPNIVVSSPLGNTPLPISTNTNLQAGSQFLPVLLNVRNIKLDDSLFSDPAFSSLVDSSISIEPDGNEGRSNPFAPLGQDVVTTPTTTETTETVPEVPSDS